MKLFRALVIGAWLAALGFGASAAAPPAVVEKDAPPNPDAAATLVVFNENDRDSEELARFYAEKRGVPADQVLGLKCAALEEITREEYDANIAEPLRRALTTNLWWKLRDPDDRLGPVESNKIRFVALMRGMPLKIAPVVKYAGDKVTGVAPVGLVNAASVDSEIAVLGARLRAISGALPNPYFRAFTPIAEANRPDLMLVCRLDAPTPQIVRRMITDALATEREGLAGFAYIDARGTTEAGYVEGDEWLFAVAETAARRGSPVVLDNGPATFPEGYPMTQAALYFGWYADHISGPFLQPEFRFARGAIAVHIHSFSAATLHEPLRHWAGPLLAAGAAATLGNVYEPYLTLTPHLNVFHDRLRAGLTFAESAYMSERVLSWMTTFVGDPLYRPYRGAVELEERPARGVWADYRQGARLWFTDRAAGETALRAAGKKNRSGMILEGLGLLQLTVNDRAAALANFALAREYYGKSDDALRVAMHEVIQLRAAGRTSDALVLSRKMGAAMPGALAVQLIRAIAEPPPPVPVMKIENPPPVTVPAKR